MKPLFFPVLAVPDGAALKFPEYQPKADSKDPKLFLDAMRRKALEEVSIILKKDAARRFERDYLDDLRADPQRYLVEHTPPRLMTEDKYNSNIWNMSNDEALAIIREYSPTLTPDLPLNEAPHEESSVRYAEETYKMFISDMEIIDLLHTETIRYLALSYDGPPSDNWCDSLQSAIPSRENLTNLVNAGEDVNTIIKNFAAYRMIKLDLWQRRAFDDVRRADPMLDRTDLYNLTGEDKKWAARIIEVSMCSRSIWHENVRSGATGITDPAEAKEEIKRTLDRPHITNEIASLLREGDAWTGRVTSFMKQRKLTNTEVSLELVRRYYLEGSLTLNVGIL